MASQNFPLEPRQNDTFNDIWPQKNLWSTFSKKKKKRVTRGCFTGRRKTNSGERGELYEAMMSKRKK